MKPILIFLTEAYPFGKDTEAFIEPEIEIAAQYFEEIHIFPSSQNINLTEKRDISSSKVFIHVVPRHNIFIEFIQNLKYIFTHKGFWQDVILLEKIGILTKINAWKKLIYGILTEAVIRRYFRNENISFDVNVPLVIYSYWLFGEAGGAVALKKMFKNDKVAVSRGHGTDIFGYQHLNNYSPLINYYLENLDAIYPVSNTGKQILIDKYNKHKSILGNINEKILPFHLGIEDSALVEIDQDPREHVFTIVSCSSLVPVKRVNLIVEALSHIRIKQIRWIHIGSGILEDKIKKDCQNILGSNIFYELRGTIPRSDVLEFYKTNYVHLFINVSSSEGIPVSMMEAFSFGIPAIATNVGGTSELCHDGVNGFLIQKDFEPEVLSEQINRFINLTELNSDEYLLLRQNARKTMLDEFSISNHTYFVKDIISRLHTTPDHAPH